MKAEHKTVVVRVGTLEADIDVKIAPLIEGLWELDLVTFNSCQDNDGNNGKGKVWIEFACVEYAETFLNLVAEYSDSPKAIYNRIRECGWDDGWDYRCHVEDWGVSKREVADTTEETFRGKHDFSFTVSVRFPRKHLKYVTQKVLAAVAKQALQV